MAQNTTRYIFEAEFSDLQKVADKLRELQKLEAGYANEAKAAQQSIKDAIAKTKLERQLASEQAKSNANTAKLAEAELSREYDKQRGILGQLKADLKAFKLERDRASDPASIKELTAAIKQTQAEINKLTEASNYFKGSAGVFRETRNALAGIFAISTVKSWIGEIFQAQAQMDRFNIATETFVKNSATRAKLQSDLINFAKTTIYDLQQVQDNASALLARGFNVGDILPNLKAIASVATATGGEFKLIAKAIGDVKDKGVLMGQEFNQFSNNSVPLIQIVADTLEKKLNVSSEKALVLARQMKDDHKITYDLIIESFRNASTEGGRYFGILEKGAQTVQGSFSNFQESIGLALAKVGTYFNDTSISVLKFGRDLLQTLFGTNTAVERTIKTIGGLITAFAGWQIGLKAVAAWNVITTGSTGALSVAQGTAILVTRSLGLSNDVLSASQVKAAASARAFWAVLAANPIGVIITALGLAYTAYKLFIEQQDLLKEKTIDALVPLKQEKIEFDKLTKSVLDTNKSTKERETALAELKKLYPDQLKGINSLKDAEAKLGAVIRDTNLDFAIRQKLIENEIRLEIAREKQTDLIRKKIEIENKLKTASKKEQTVATLGGSYSIGSDAGALEYQLKAVNAQFDELGKGSETALTNIEKLKSKLKYKYDSNSAAPPNGNTGGGAGGGSAKTSRPERQKEYEAEAQDEMLFQLRMQKIRLQMNEENIKDKKEYEQAMLVLDNQISSQNLTIKYEKEQEKAKGNTKALKIIKDNWNKEMIELSENFSLQYTKIETKAHNDQVKAQQEANKKKWADIVDLAKKKRSELVSDLEHERKISFDKIDIAKNELIEKLNNEKEEKQSKTTSKVALLQIEADHNTKVRELNIKALEEKKVVIDAEFKAFKAKFPLKKEEEKKWKELVSGIEKDISDLRTKGDNEGKKSSRALKLARIADSKEAQDFLIANFAKSESAYIRGVGNMISIYQKMKENIDKGGDSSANKIVAGIGMAAAAASAFAEARLENIAKEIRAEDARYNREVNNINAKYDLENAKYDAIINKRKTLEDELMQAILAHDTTKIGLINAEILAYEAQQAKKKELEAQFEEARRTNNVAEIERIGNELLKYTEAERNKVENDKLRAAELAEAKKKHENELHELKIKQLKAQFSATVAQAIQTGALAVLGALSIPIVGPYLAGVMAVLVGVQIGIAKRQRDAAIAELEASRGYFDGTDRLPLGGNKKGRDTIPINAHEGERIMPTRDNDKLRERFGRDVSNKELVQIATKPRMEIMPTKDIQELINQRMAIEFAMNTKTIEKGLKEVVDTINNKETITWNVDQTGYSLGRQKANTLVTRKQNEFFGRG